MRSIDITTTQNVTIQYGLASVRDRAMAYFLDGLIVLGILLIMSILIGIIADGFGGAIWFYLLLLPIFIFYHLFFEIFQDGQSPGKKAMGLKVVKITGKEPIVSDYITRWAFRMIDIHLSFGVLGGLLINSSAKGQRLGGLVSNTTVIHLRPRIEFKLQDILKIDSISNHEVTYPEVRQFSEQDMLLIKKVIERAQKYRNPAHFKIVDELCEKLSQKMELDRIPKKKIKFLKLLIKDYVVLTR